MKKLRIRSGDIQLLVDLLDTPTARTLFSAAPFRSAAQIWGEEVYFTTPIQVELEADARDIVEAGELAFWVEGNCIAMGYGPTPISQSDEIRLAAPTNIWGITTDDVRLLSKVKAGDTIDVELAD